MELMEVQTVLNAAESHDHEVALMAGALLVPAFLHDHSGSDAACGVLNARKECMKTVYGRILRLSAVLLAASCAPNLRPSPTPASPAATYVSPISPATTYVSPSSPTGTYVAINLNELRSYPEARAHGSFEKVRGCVYLRHLGGSLLLPIFPNGTRLVQESGSSFVLSTPQARVVPNKSYVVGGGAVNLDNPEVRLSSPIPSRCTGRPFIVGTISEKRGA